VQFLFHAGSANHLILPFHHRLAAQRSVEPLISLNMGTSANHASTYIKPACRTGIHKLDESGHVLNVALSDYERTGSGICGEVGSR
jgi:hypothetical protein